MGYTTDFVGSLHIDPPLNEHERALMQRISRSTMPEARHLGEAIEQTLALPGRPPPAWCAWEVCFQGCCLSWDGTEKPYEMLPWLEYLMETFIVPGADAEGLPGFEEFTFDHRVNGMVVGSRRDNRELYSITVRDNDLEVELLWPGNPRWSAYPPLGYQIQIDNFREWACGYRLGQLRQAEEDRQVAEYGGQLPW